MLQRSMGSLPQTHSRIANHESSTQVGAIENLNGKTPARANNAQRRAFGDISNRKGLRPNISTTIQKNVYDGKTPNQRFIQNENPIKTTFDSSAIKEQSILTKNKTAKELRDVVGSGAPLLPNPMERMQRSSKSALLSNEVPLDELEIEHSAGLLYDDQRSFDWDDGPSDPWLEGAKTFRQDWIDTFQEIHDARLKMTEQKIQESIRNLDKIVLEDMDGT